MLRLLGEEITFLSQKNSRVKGSNTEVLDASSPSRGGRNARQNRRGKKKSAGDGGVGLGGLADLESADSFSAPSAQEQQFMDQVQANVEEQNEMLDQISLGLSELKELSLDIGKTLDVQNGMIEELDNKMEDTIQQYQTANSRLKDMLDQSGGMTRWCPRITLLIVLLSIVAYMIVVFGKNKEE